MSKNLVSQKVPKEFDDFVKNAIIDKQYLERRSQIPKDEILSCMVKYFKSNDVAYTNLIKTKCKT